MATLETMTADKREERMNDTVEKVTARLHRHLTLSCRRIKQHGIDFVTGI